MDNPTLISEPNDAAVVKFDGPEIMRRASEIRYGSGCSAETAIRLATEEFAEWDAIITKATGAA